MSRFLSWLKSQKPSLDDLFLVYRVPESLYRCDMRLDGTKFYPFLFEDWGDEVHQLPMHDRWMISKLWVEYAYEIQRDIWRELVPR